MEPEFFKFLEWHAVLVAISKNFKHHRRLFVGSDITQREAELVC